MHQVTFRWGAQVRWLAIAMVVTALMRLAPSASAQIFEDWDRVTVGQPGLEQAIIRHYYDEDYTILAAYLSRFDSDANALAAFDMIAADRTDPSWTESSIQVDSLGPNTLAWASESDITGNTADIVTVEGRYLYIAAITAMEPGVDTVTIASETVEAMVAAEGGKGLGEFVLDGSSTGGAWDKLPPGDGTSPAGFFVDYDTQVYPEPEEPTDSDLASLDGIQRGVSRTYVGDPDALATPQSAPPATYVVSASVFQFDTADHAAAAVEPIHAELLASFDDDTITLEPTDPGGLGDQAVAEVGTAEEDGATYELTLLVTQAGTRVYMVAAVGIGADAGSLETARAITGTMMEAEPGSDAGTFDESGGSTGGLWDIFPADGDSVLAGLTADSDAELYP